MKNFFLYQTNLGQILIEETDKKITKINFCGQDKKEDFIKQENTIQIETALIKQTYQQLQEYLAGQRKKFDIPIKMKGTQFQIKVWNELLKIPYGQTRSYQEIAVAIENPKAVRAVGMANHNNPIGIIVPCHRVIGKNGNLTGYAGGLDIKEKLLKLEQNNI